MYCQKCGKSVQDGAEFCMRCGAKVTQENKPEKQKQNDEKINKAFNHAALEKNEIEKNVDAVENKSMQNKQSNAYVQINKTSENTVNTTSQTLSKSSDKPKQKKKGLFVKIKGIKTKYKVIAIVALVLIIVGVVGGLVYYNEFTPDGKYNKGITVYNYLRSYETKTEGQKYLACDEECIKKLEEGKKYFEEAGNTKDAKLFYYDFKIAVNLFRTNADNGTASSNVYLKQAITDLRTPIDKKYVPSLDAFGPDSEAQKLYLFLDGMINSSVGVASENRETTLRGYNCFSTLETANNGPFTFCGKSSFDMKQGLDFRARMFKA